MNSKLILSAIASVGVILCSNLPVFALDAQLRATHSDSKINFRAAPNVKSPSRGYGLPGDWVKIIRNSIGANNNRWYYVEFYETGARGWIDGTFIQPIGGDNSSGGIVISTEPQDDQVFEIKHYTVRVYVRDGQIRLNVFNRRQNRVEFEGISVKTSKSRYGILYEGRNVTLFLSNDGKRTLTID